MTNQLRIAHTLSALGAALALVALPYLYGCGGGGKTGATGSLSLTSSKTNVVYGEPVTISWSAKSGAIILEGQCNFPADTQSGSLVDRPSYDTTYRIQGTDGQGNTISKTRKVTVPKSTKQILLVGNPSVAGTNQIQQYLQSVTTQPVSVRTTVTSLAGNDVVVLLPSATYTAADNASVMSYLSGGGAVILVEQAPRRLATGGRGHR